MRKWIAMGAMLALANGAAAVPTTLAYDEAGNYEAGMFTNGSNRGFSFDAWALTNQPAELGDSTAGGGGDVDSTNGVAFRFMGDGAGGWGHGRRDFAAALRPGDVASFVFAYNWSGGGRGVDLHCATGQFANLIHITDGNMFQVNSQTVSAVWAPQAVVAVEIVQETNGIRVGVVRTTNGVEDLNYSTNLLHATPLTGLDFYCGGYSCAPADNPNYALFVNDLRIAGEPPQVIASAGMAASNQFRLEWPAETGLVYRVETTPDLIEQPWNNATPEGLAFTDLTGACELSMDGPRRFYRFAADRPTHLVVDLSGGPEAETWPVSYLDAVPDGGWTDEYKTTKLVLRRISGGTFTMGSPTNELGRRTNELQRAVTLTREYYVGVFEVTQKQWERVMGNWPSYFINPSYRDSRPVEMVRYNDIRGTGAGTNWPTDGNVDTNSFMGGLRAKTGLAFDLPTEAQWEYACRAGTTNALNSGKELTTTTNCLNMDVAGRYWYNGGLGYTVLCTASNGSATVASYQPSAWGLYDTHGNVMEWCLDWYEGSTAGALDPLGPSTGSNRVVRGGGWGYEAYVCRSAFRGGYAPSYRNISLGFRVFLPPGQQGEP